MIDHAKVYDTVSFSQWPHGLISLCLSLCYILVIESGKLDKCPWYPVISSVLILAQEVF